MMPRRSQPSLRQPPRSGNNSTKRRQSKFLLVWGPLSMAGLCVVAMFTTGSVVVLLPSTAELGNHHHHHPNPLWAALHNINPNNNIRRKVTTATTSDGNVLDLRNLYPVEEPIPNPPLANGYDTFSACMLIMDDNHRLVEWLAYHYHVLPLRHLVVTIDPRSVTSSTWLFNRWRKMGVVIEVWEDADYWKKGSKLQPIPENATLRTKRDRHRGRQKFFYRSCLAHLKSVNRTWVALHDSDEFLLYNHAGGEQYQRWEDNMQYRHEHSAQRGKEPRIKPTITPPTTAEEGGMIKYIRHEQEAGLDYYQSPCIGVPRLSFGAVEMNHEAQQHNVPDGIDPRRLDTLRYNRHASRNNFVKNALGKVLMDVSRIDVKRSPFFMSLHRPIKTICPAPWHDDWKSGLRINHYLGSWESYALRDDSRRGNERSREQWEYKATTNIDATDDNIRPWIQGFVAAHDEQHSTLLADAGIPPGTRLPLDEAAWRLNPERLAEILDVNETVMRNDNKQMAFEAWVRQKYGR